MQEPRSKGGTHRLQRVGGHVSGHVGRNGLRGHTDNTLTQARRYHASEQDTWGDTSSTGLVRRGSSMSFGRGLQSAIAPPP